MSQGKEEPDYLEEFGSPAEMQGGGDETQGVGVVLQVPVGACAPQGYVLTVGSFSCIIFRYSPCIAAQVPGCVPTPGGIRAHLP